jgi:hypothetical protein
MASKAGNSGTDRIIKYTVEYLLPFVAYPRQIERQRPERHRHRLTSRHFPGTMQRPIENRHEDGSQMNRKWLFHIAIWAVCGSVISIIVATVVSGNSPSDASPKAFWSIVIQSALIGGVIAYTDTLASRLITASAVSAAAFIPTGVVLQAMALLLRILPAHSGPHQFASKRDRSSDFSLVANNKNASTAVCAATPSIIPFHFQLTAAVNVRRCSPTSPRSSRSPPM